MAIMTAVAGVSFGVHASIIQTWNDEALFLAANPLVSMESFESTSSNLMPLVAGDITVTTDSPHDFFNGVAVGFGIPDGVQGVKFAADNGNSIFFTFSDPTKAFGITIRQFGDVGGAPVLTVHDDLGNSHVVYSGPHTANEFFGFVSDADMTTVRFTATGGNPGDGIYFDKLQYDAVPEPASIGLIGLFTGGIYFVRRFFVV